MPHDIWDTLGFGTDDAPAPSLLAPLVATNPPTVDEWETAGRRRSKRWLRRLVIVMTLMLLLATSGIGAAWWWAGSVAAEMSSGKKKQTVTEAREVLGTAPARPIVSRQVYNPGLKGAMTILLIGSDSRKGESGRGRSDTMMLARVNPASKQISVLSLPRDLWVDIPGYGYSKLNSAYSYGGPKLAIETLRDAFGVRIDHFVVVDFQGFRGLVDGLEGVWVPIDKRYYNHNDGSSYNNYSDIDLKPGYQLLKGQKALEFARYRHGDSDFIRAARQQLVMSETKQRLKTLDVWRSPAILRLLAKNMTSDMDDPQLLLRLVHTLVKTPQHNMTRVVLAKEGGLVGGAYIIETSEAERAQYVRAWLQPTKYKIPSPVKKQATQNRQAQLAKEHQANPERYRQIMIWKMGKGIRPKPPTKAQLRAAQQANLLPTDSQAAQMIAQGRSRALRSFCIPTRQLPSAQWDSEMPSRAYEILGHPSWAMSAELSTGRSILWMQTTWKEPPMLAEPSEVRTLKGKTLHFYRQSGKLRALAIKEGRGWTWITNTLDLAVEERALIALAVACK